jgi:hypothetical protein
MCSVLIEITKDIYPTLKELNGWPEIEEKKLIDN